MAETASQPRAVIAAEYLPSEGSLMKSQEQTGERISILAVENSASEQAGADGEVSIQARLNEAMLQARMKKSSKARAKKPHQKPTVAVVFSFNGTSGSAGTATPSTEEGSNADVDTASSDEEDARFGGGLGHVEATIAETRETRLDRKMKRQSAEQSEAVTTKLTQYQFINHLTQAKEQEVRDRARGKEVVASYRRKNDRKHVKQRNNQREFKTHANLP